MRLNSFHAYKQVVGNLRRRLALDQPLGYFPLLVSKMLCLDNPTAVRTNGDVLTISRNQTTPGNVLFSTWLCQKVRESGTGKMRRGKGMSLYSTWPTTWEIFRPLNSSYSTWPIIWLT